MARWNEGNKPNNKRTKAEQEALVNLGAQWLYENPTASRGVFVKWLMEEHGLARKWAYEYRKRCYAKVHELQDKDIESKRTLRVAALERLFHQAQTEGDIKAQLQVLQELNKVDNLYVHKVETNEKEARPIFNITLDENGDSKLKKVD